jgi:hypothetical protein
MFDAGINDAIIGGISGGILGGIVGGIDAYIDDRSFWTGELPESGNNKIWGKMTIYTDDSGEGSMRGHSWLETESLEGENHSYGTWGNRDLNGNAVNSFNPESTRTEFWTDYIYDNHLNRTYTHSYTREISFAEKMRFDKFTANPKNVNWSPSYNCSGFARNSFNYTTGSRIVSHPFMFPINTPARIASYLTFFRH